MMTPDATSPLVELGPLERFAVGAHVVALPAAVIAVYSVHGTLYAIGDTCLRCGTSLASGNLDETIVECPCCKWRYDVITGEVIGVPRLRTDVYALRVVDGMLVSEGACDTCTPVRHE
jgi:nitrite reductase/ring-hydroxylating ferredoxin subunit